MKCLVRIGWGNGENPRLDYIFSAKKKKIEVELCALIFNFTPNRHERENHRERKRESSEKWKKGAFMKYIYTVRVREMKKCLYFLMCVWETVVLYSFVAPFVAPLNKTLDFTDLARVLYKNFRKNILFMCPNCMYV